MQVYSESMHEAYKMSEHRKLLNSLESFDIQFGFLIAEVTIVKIEM